MSKRKSTEHLSDSEKAIMFCEYNRLRKIKPAPKSITRDLRVFLEKSNINPPRRECVLAWITLWDENNGEFLLQKPRKKRKKTKVDENVEAQVKRELIKKCSVRSVALTSKFKTKTGNTITLGKPNNTFPAQLSLFFLMLSLTF